ncbi:hypothetical protein Avbf_03925 [Armadillidium vulgare]|nr:hypothetical protein Avbf_03925 [Armadillidium vulgare]
MIPTREDDIYLPTKFLPLVTNAYDSLLNFDDGSILETFLLQQDGILETFLVIKNFNRFSSNICELHLSVLI